MPALMDACARLSRGEVIMAEHVSAGPWTPAAPDGFTWAVLNLQGAPLWLGHDAFECARAFLSMREYDPANADDAIDLADLAADPRRQPTDAEAVAADLYDRWRERYQWSGLPMPRSLVAFGYSEVG